MDIDIADVAGFVDAVIVRTIPLSALLLMIFLFYVPIRQESWVVAVPVAIAVVWALKSDYRGGLD